MPLDDDPFEWGEDRRIEVEECITRINRDGYRRLLHHNRRALRDRSRLNTAP